MDFTYDVTMFKETFEHEFTYINGFMRNVRRFADRPALFCPERQRRWTYAELNLDVNRFAHSLKDDGVGKNDVVMYMLPNSAEFIFCYLAPQKLGAINSPINFRIAPGEVALLIDFAKPKVFVYDGEFTDTVMEAMSHCEFAPSRMIMVDMTGEREIPKGHIRYDDYVYQASVEEPVMEHPAHIYDETTRLYTSGTTSLPKGVPINNINEVLSAHDVMMHFPLGATDRTMNMTPWFHRGGIHSGGPCPTLYAGGEVIVLRYFTPKLCLEYVEKYKVTFITGVPSLLDLLSKKQERTPSDLSSLKGVVTMGSPLERSACIRFQKTLSPNIFNGYGTTESFWNTFLRPYNLPEMAGSAGQTCTDDDVLVVKSYPDRRSEPYELVEQNNAEIGEILIKSPAKSTYCYYNNPEETKKKFYKGYMYTGDLGTWDKNQFVTIVGRKDDMIICSGENIYPAQIEEVINEHPKVSECIVTNVPDPKRGQAVAAYIIPADESLEISEIAAFCASHPMLSAYKRPRYYAFTDSLPMTATGKKMHYKAREMAARDLEAGVLKRP